MLEPVRHQRQSSALALLACLLLSACGDGKMDPSPSAPWAGYRAFHHSQAHPSDQASLLVVDSGGAKFARDEQAPDSKLDGACVAMRYGSWTEQGGRIEVRFDWYAMDSEEREPPEAGVIVAHELSPPRLLSLERQEDGLYRTVASDVPLEEVGQLWDLHPVRTAPALYLAKEILRPRMPDTRK